MSSPDIRALTRFDVARLRQLCDHVNDTLDSVRGIIYDPAQKKVAPRFAASFVAGLAGMDPQQFARELARNRLPTGTSVNRARREFEVHEIREWTRFFGRCHRRAAGEPGFVITVAIAKGGAAKTTTTMKLGQGLSLFGYKVLVIDLDAQASLTEMCGLKPETEVTPEQTALPLFDGDERTLHYAIQPTYWPGLSLVPASQGLFGSEFSLPARQMQATRIVDGKRVDPDFDFWRELERSLDRPGPQGRSIREEYDVVLIDTPPAMGYVTLNALFAANGVVMPLPPQGVDFAGSVQFLNLFTRLAAEVDPKSTLGPKSWDFFKVLTTKVKPAKAGDAMPTIVSAAYGDNVMGLSIAESSAYTNMGSRLSTLFDVGKAPDGTSRDAFLKARETALRLVEQIDCELRLSWPSAAARTSAPAREAARQEG